MRTLFNQIKVVSGDFTNRPTVNGTGMLLSGEGGQPNVVYTSGNQTISGNKTFTGTTTFSGTTNFSGVTNFSGTGFFNQGILLNSGSLIVSGLRNFPSGVVPATMTGSAFATVVYGSPGTYGNDGITFNYRIYTYKNYLGAKVFSTGYKAVSVTDNGASDSSEYVQIGWSAVSGVDGYRVLIDNTSNLYGFNYYMDSTSLISFDGYTGNSLGNAISYMPPILRASSNDGLVSVMGDVSMTGNFNVASGTLKISGQNVLTGSTASFITTGQTGAFVTTGQTGSFITGTQTTGSVIFKQQYASLEVNAASGINWNSGNVQYYGMVTGVQTLTFTNPISGGRYILILKQPASGTGATVNWPTGVLWGGGTSPTLTTTTGKVDLISFIYDGINSKYYGNSSLNF